MTLSPKMAAQMANGVYGIRETTNIVEGFRQRGAAGGGLMDAFDLEGSGRRLEGVSGGRVLTHRSGFATVLHGKGHARQGEIAIICRGTQIKYDWLSNFAASVESGPGGTVVHAGFNRVFKSFNRGLSEALHGHNPTTIHVVGHSLGGALANLVALQYAGRANVKLYTFGAPRPGLGNFAQTLERRLGKDNIKRVYALADPVPMVPLYPFCHAPVSQGLRISEGGQLISVNAHFMDNYGPAVADQCWAGMAAASSAIPNMKSVDFWLGQAQQHNTIPGGTAALFALNMALSGILSLAGKVVGYAALRAATVLDRLALMLQHAVAVSAEMGRLLSRFVQQVMRFLGRAASTVAEVTRSFLSYVLRLLFTALVQVARSALSRLA